MECSVAYGVSDPVIVRIAAQGGAGSGARRNGGRNAGLRGRRVEDDRIGDLGAVTRQRAHSNQCAWPGPSRGPSPRRNPPVPRSVP